MAAKEARRYLVPEARVTEALHTLLRDGWTGLDVADALDVNQSTVSRWKRGAMPKGEKRRELIDFLHEQGVGHILEAGKESDAPTLTKVVSDVSTAPVIASIEAGAWREEGAMGYVGTQREVHGLPGLAENRQVAFVIGDHSMAGRSLVPGMYALCAPIEDIRPNGPDIGDIVIIERHRSGLVETTLREVRSIRDGLRLESRPDSGAPEVRAIKDGTDDTGIAATIPYILLGATIRFLPVA